MHIKPCKLYPAGLCYPGTHHQGVLMHDHAAVLAVGAQVVVCTLRAPEPMTSLNLEATVVAGAGKGGRIRVVQMVQHHSAAVLGSPDGVKLVVVALAQRQEGLQEVRGTFSEFERLGTTSEPTGSDGIKSQLLRSLQASLGVIGALGRGTMQAGNRHRLAGMQRYKV